MKTLLGIASALTLAFGLGGCATPTKMAFEKPTEQLTAEGGAVYLMTVTIKNLHHPTFQPKLIVAHVERPNAKSKADRLNFVMDKKAELNQTADKPKKKSKSKSKSNPGQAESPPDAPPEGHTYLLRMRIPPGEYSLRGLTGLASKFPVNGFFFAHMDSKLNVAAESGVIYLGHVAATVRERQGDELRAGPVIPLIDQAVAGASSGAFDITITDEFAAYEKSFRERFPQLATVEIRHEVLPPYDKEAVRQAWKPEKAPEKK
jgi:hypothetical protein